MLDRKMTPRDVTKLRESLQMNQAQFAALLRVSQAAVSYWESGARPVQPSMAELMRLKAEECRRQAVAVA